MELSWFMPCVITILYTKRTFQTCDTTPVFCHYSGHKPRNVYSSTEALDVGLCLTKCRMDMACIVAGYTTSVRYPVIPYTVCRFVKVQ